MAKSKNHTAHNNSKKDHRHGIKKPNLRKEAAKWKGVCPKLMRERRRANKIRENAKITRRNASRLSYLSKNPVAKSLVALAAK